MNKETDSPLICPICLLPHVNPKFLPCFHSCCASCLHVHITETTNGNKIIVCPLCRQRCPLPQKGVEALVSNFYIVQKEKEDATGELCNTCRPTTKGSKQCETCKQVFCENCSKIHVDLKANKSHRVVDLRHSTYKTSQLELPTCSVHRNTQLICKECTVKPKFLKLTAKLIKSFNLPYEDAVYGIGPVPGTTTAWVSLMESQDVHLVDMSGSLLKSIATGSDGQTVCSDRNGNCYVTSTSDKCVKRIKEDGQVEIIVTNMYNIFGVAVKDSDADGVDIFTTDCSASGSVNVVRGRTYTRKLYSQRFAKFLAMDQMGDLLCVTEGDKGQLTMLRTDGQFIARYKRGFQSSKPYGVCFDKTGCVIFADYIGKDILRINREGQLIQVLLEGLDYRPCSISIDSNNRLWIGFTGGVIEIYQLI